MQSLLVLCLHVACWADVLHLFVLVLVSHVSAQCSKLRPCAPYWLKLSSLSFPQVFFSPRLCVQTMSGSDHGSLSQERTNAMDLDQGSLEAEAKAASQIVFPTPSGSLLFPVGVDGADFDAAQ